MKSLETHNQFLINWRMDIQLSRYPWMYGYFYLSVGDAILGKPEEVETLNAIVACSKHWSRLTTADCPCSLFILPTLPAFLSIEFARYGLDHLRSIVPMGFKPVHVAESFNCQFDAGESSDDYRLYVLAKNGIVRLIFNVLRSEPREVVVQTVEFDSVVTTAIEGLEMDFAALEKFC